MEEKKLQQESRFDSKDISEKSKEALQSETWQKVRESLKHFTPGDNTGSNVYPTKWGMLVNKYLATGYKDGKKVGVTCSGTFLPFLKGAYATALVEDSAREMGSEFQVDVRGRMVECEQVKSQFYKRQ